MLLSVCPFGDERVAWTTVLLPGLISRGESFVAMWRVSEQWANWTIAVRSRSERRWRDSDYASSTMSFVIPVYLIYRACALRTRRRGHRRKIAKPPGDFWKLSSALSRDRDYGSRMTGEIFGKLLKYYRWLSGPALGEGPPLGKFRGTLFYF